MKEEIISILTSKRVAAFVVPLIVRFGVKYGLDINDELATDILNVATFGLQAILLLITKFMDKGKAEVKA